MDGQTGGYMFPPLGNIIIGNYTVDCTIPTYIWTSAQMTTNMVQYGKVIWARVEIYFGIVQSTV
mgnify:FL=1